MNKKFLKSYLIAAVVIIAVPLIYFKISKGPQLAGTPATFRYAFMANEKVWTFLQSTKRMSVAKKAEMGKPPRVNGLIGLKTSTSAQDYKIHIEQDNRIADLPLSAVYVLPKSSHSTDFRCIEGWSEETQYAGATFSAFMKAQNLGIKADGSYYQYVGLETPDGEYYVSIDMESMLHPQTLLAWEMNGRALSLKNGFPLRLMIPIKYGIKSLKRIGKITFSDEKPRDYWAERGYDWYSGL